MLKPELHIHRSAWPGCKPTAEGFTLRWLGAVLDVAWRSGDDGATPYYYITVHLGRRQKTLLNWQPAKYRNETEDQYWARINSLIKKEKDRA